MKKSGRLSTYWRETSREGKARDFLRLLIVIDLLLVVAFVFTFIFYKQTSILFRFHLDVDRNIPAGWSALLLFAAGVAAYGCRRVEERQFGWFPARFVWDAAGVLLWALAADEYYSFHERAGSFLVDMDLLSASNATLGGFGWSWTLVGIPVALIVGAAVWPLFKKIFAEEPGLFKLLTVSAVIYLSGTLAMENFRVFLSARDLGWNMPTLIAEEFLEMLGASLAVYAILVYRARLLDNQSLNQGAECEQPHSFA